MSKSDQPHSKTISGSAEEEGSSSADQDDRSISESTFSKLSCERDFKSPLEKPESPPSSNTD